MAQETISHDEHDPDWLICICGNNPERDGFDPCDTEGKYMEPDINWKGHYICTACGRIIEQRSLKVIGRKQP